MTFPHSKKPTFLSLILKKSLKTYPCTCITRCMRKFNLHNKHQLSQYNFSKLTTETSVASHKSNFMAKYGII